MENPSEFRTPLPLLEVAVVALRFTMGLKLAVLVVAGYGVSGT
jgi:hypothetical protein